MTTTDGDTAPPSQPARAPDGAPTSSVGGQRWWWIVLGFLMLWNLVTLLPIWGGAADIPYSTFIEQVNAGNVTSVTFDGQDVAGAFREPVAWPPASGAAQPSGSAPASPTASAVATPAASSGAGNEAASGTTFTTFETVMPPQGDPALLPALEQHGVTVSANASGGSSLVLDLLIGGLPVVLLIGVGLLMARGVQRSQQGIFGFGGSRARRYDAERPSVTFADVAGVDDAKEELGEVVDFLRDPQRYRRLGARLPRGVLLIGPPGAGKTLLARAVAGEARAPFFSISASEFVEMFVGVGASRVRDLFAKAKSSAPSIVFVDEIDAVGRQRGSGPVSNDEREQTLNQLLVEMDGFDDQTNVIVIAATNRPDVLDGALLRPGRFDRQVTVGYPDRAGREAILRIHTHHLRLDPSVDLGELARQTPGLSGADLANLANEAALIATRRGAPAVARSDFLAAVDKVTLGTRQPGLKDAEERRLVAYHEGAHAIVALSIPGSDPVEKVTIVPHGRALGVTQQVPVEDRRNFSRGYLMGRLAALLAGHVGEQLVFGQPSTGAESDLQQATRLARQMVTRWGMSEAVGPLWLGPDADAPVAPLEGSPIGAERTAARVDDAVEAMIDEAGSRARVLLEKKRSMLDALADELLEHEVVDGARLDQLAAAGGSARPAAA